MNLKGRLTLVLASALFLSGCTIPFAQQKAGLQVTVNPQANVFLDGKALGQTPVYNDSLQANTYTVKVTANDPTLSSWEGKVTLNPGVLTVVDRQLSSDPTKAFGYIISFEKLTKKDASEVNIISSPDTVSVTVDGSPVGFTPFKGDSIAAGPHNFTISSPGYQDLNVKGTVKAGYRLVINAQMATQAVTPTPSPTPLSTPSATPTPSIIKKITPQPKQASSSAVLKPYVEIKSTPTGFLRVRQTPSSSGAEVSQVNPGDRFPYLDISPDNAWYQITYSGTSKGWVSAQYSTLVQ